MLISFYFIIYFTTRLCSSIVVGIYYSLGFFNNIDPVRQIAAYQSALNMQVECMEIDASRTGDGVLVALHDRYSLTWCEYCQYNPLNKQKQSLLLLSLSAILKAWLEL